MWKSKWAWITKDPGPLIQRCFFRQCFSLSVQGYIKIHISADSRYKFYIDGQWIGEGPAAGDLLNYRYETYGFEKVIKLGAGRHIVAVEVLSYGRAGPLNEIHERGGLIVEGGVFDEKGVELTDLTTPGDWRVCEDPSFGADFSLGGVPFYCAVGFTENIDFRQAVGNWLDLEYDDNAWAVPVPIAGGGGAMFSDPPTLTISPWLLTPREIPPMEKVPQRFSRVMSCDAERKLHSWQSLIEGGRPLTVPAKSRVSVILAPESYVTAYPEVELEGGYNSVVRLTYGESFSCKWDKDVRDDPDGKDIEGYSDTLVAGNGRYFYTPVQWRAFRFLKVDIQTADTPLVFHRLSLCCTSYPMKLKAAWRCDRSLLNDLWPVSWRSLRTAAHEHLQDSPYYERLQYVGDSNIQALTIQGLTGDVRLWKRAVLDFNASRLPMGLTQSRYPSRHIQVIPAFSLVYIVMVKEYYLHTEDRQTVQFCLRGLTQIIDWFSDYLTSDGYLGTLPWWNFVDWAKEWPSGDPSGAPYGPDKRKPSATLNFHFIWALQSLAQIYEWLEDADKAALFRAQAQEVLAAVRAHFWDPRKELFAEDLTKTTYSEHANTLAILTDAAEYSVLQKIAESLDNCNSLIASGYQFEFHLARAFSKVNRVDLMLKRLDQWQKIFDLHLVTTPERQPGEGLIQRSDNHAWSAWTPYWMLSEVLGIKPLEPGFKKIQIKPQLGGLRFIEASMPLPSGLLKLRVEVTENLWTISGELPSATYTLEDPSGKVHEFSGGEVNLNGCFSLPKGAHISSVEIDLRGTDCSIVRCGGASIARGTPRRLPDSRTARLT
jgi:hypothetical protein